MSTSRFKRPVWLTKEVLALAEAEFQTFDPERRLILADALEEAGCTNESALEHLRKGCNLPDTRKCWVLSYLLQAFPM